MFLFLHVWVGSSEGTNLAFSSFLLDGYRPGAPWGSRLVRGRTRADHARADRGRARQVCRALLYPHAVVQGTYIPVHRSATFELLDGRSTDRKVRTVYCVHTRGTGEVVASRTGPCETVRA